jgi:preprotein translocase subunit SecE
VARAERRSRHSTDQPVDDEPTDTTADRTGGHDVTETRENQTPSRDRGEARKPLPARISLFYRQVVAELRKVLWPTRRELLTYTSVVIVFVLIVIAYVSVLDFGFAKGILAIFG